MIGSIQAAEAIKWICGIGDPLVGRLLIIDMLAMSFDEFAISRNPACALCGDHPTITEPIAYVDACVGGGDGDLGEADYDDAERITPRAAKRRLDHGEELFILDVREPIEYQMSRLPSSTLIPLGQLTARAETELGLRRDQEIIVVCHHGNRSQVATRWLREQGFKRAKNLDGGIDRWAAEADPSIPRY